MKGPVERMHEADHAGLGRAYGEQVSREVIEHALLIQLVEQIEAYNASNFSGFKWSDLMKTVRQAKRVLEEPVS